MATNEQLTRILNEYQSTHDINNQMMADALGVTMTRYKRLSLPITEWMWSEAVNLGKLTGIGLNELAALE